MGRSAGNLTICRVKAFQNPTVHEYRSHHKESGYTVIKEKDLQKLKSKPPHYEKENEEQMETGMAHQSLRDRRAIEKSETVTRHSEELQRRIARTCISQIPCPSFRDLSSNSKHQFCFGRMGAPFESGV